MHEFELDHEVPLFQGGADTDANCQVLCHECHAAKTARDLGHAGAAGTVIEGTWVEFKTTDR
jgi:5-methylcytosine-specific restriction endonuclease McrA